MILIFVNNKVNNIIMYKYYQRSREEYSITPKYINEK